MADASQPGYGNFCYGHRSVQSITSSTENSGQPGATTVVNYQWTFSGAPDWAKAPVMQTAFPQVANDLAGNGAASATLADTTNGWVVQTGPPIPRKSVSPADYKVVGDK